HVHRRPGIHVIVIERVGMSDHATRYLAGFSIPGTLPDREMDLMYFLSRNAIGILLHVAIDDGLQHVRRTHCHAVDRNRLVVGIESSFDQSGPGLMITLRQRQLPGELANSFLLYSFRKRDRQRLGMLRVNKHGSSPGLW